MFRTVRFASLFAALIGLSSATITFLPTARADDGATTPPSVELTGTPRYGYTSFGSALALSADVRVWMTDDVALVGRLGWVLGLYGLYDYFWAGSTELGVATRLWAGPVELAGAGGVMGIYGTRSGTDVAGGGLWVSASANVWFYQPGHGGAFFLGVGAIGQLAYLTPVSTGTEQPEPIFASVSPMLRVGMAW
jgi:hypothetical protein